ncbi:hypothetical protein [Pseudonocardia kunmingensis]|uniref:Uncharacterized protein n=1 Tax=Pseudonocardia kunmingensis TaxID=630975 RepID=A0A543DQC5_9PSEU|nr:hypothetical protein [Pseudonocardia kunmingensis]TQM11513.1 hypothetical protein FB558_4077 [Pseudonocardia kunmingensis]
MNDRASRRSLITQFVRIVLAVVAITCVVFFVDAQGRGAEVTYGSPASSEEPENTPPELPTAGLPSAAEMAAMLNAEPVVRLPGAIAQWDAERVRQASGDHDVRIIATPPGLTEEQRSALAEVDSEVRRDLGDDENTIVFTIDGTRVSGGIYEAAPSTLDEWRAQFGRNDVTVPLVTLINELTGSGDEPVEGPADERREPTAAELEVVATQLRATGRFVAPGASLTEVPAEAAAEAFGGVPAMFAAFPVQPFGEQAPDYGPALTRLFPETPIVVLYGSWIEYHGPHAADFADVAAAGYYSQFGGVLGRGQYPQDNSLRLYLGQIADVRYAGLFDRPLPYTPFDPLSVTLPALPGIFAGCAALLLALSARSLLRRNASRPLGTAARLGGLSALAVEVSGLSGRAEDPALARAIVHLRAARDAVAEALPDKHVHKLLDDAEAELDRIGRAVPFDGYRPVDHLRRQRA